MITTTLDIETWTPDPPELVERDLPADPIARALIRNEHERNHRFAALTDHRPVVYAWLQADPAKGQFDIYAYKVMDEDDEQGALAHLAQCLEAADRLISYNGRSFDWPLCQLRAMKYRMCWPKSVRAEDRYLRKLWHFDIYDLLTSHGAVRRIKLDGLAKLCGLPGKQEVCGGDVKNLWESGQYELVKTYCVQDVFGTWLLYLIWVTMQFGHNVREVWSNSIRFAREHEDLAELYQDVREKF